MIDVRVGQKHEVDRFRVERKVLIVQFLRRLAPLKESAIDQETMFSGIQQGARAGDGAGGAAEGQFRHEFRMREKVIRSGPRAIHP